MRLHLKFTTYSSWAYSVTNTSTPFSLKVISTYRLPSRRSTNTSRFSASQPSSTATTATTPPLVCIVVYQMHLIDYIITLVSVHVYVCPLIGCRTITSAILYRFSPNFACRSEMWLFRALLFLGQTGSRLTIFKMCKIQFWQFRDCGGHIFPRKVTKT